jgi:hypothetical protein
MLHNQEEANGSGLFFCYSATLRIFSDEVVNVDEISQYLSISPTHSHVKGEPRLKKIWGNSMWIFDSVPTIDEETNLDIHLQYLWNTFRPVKKKLFKLKERYQVDVLCEYRSNCDTAGVVAVPSCLEIFTELNIPMKLSVVMAFCEEGRHYWDEESGLYYLQHRDFSRLTSGRSKLE